MEILIPYPSLVVGMIVLFGFLDYGLTRIGYRWYQRYRQPVIEYERYEQNPLWDRAIHRVGRYDFRHVFVMGVVGAGLWLLLTVDPKAASFETTFLVSLILLTYVHILAGHLSSLRRSHYIGTSPGEVQGKLRYSYRATLRLGVMGDQVEFVPWFVLFLLVPHPVTLAAAVVPLMIASARDFWLRLHDLRSEGRRPHPLRVLWECGIATSHVIIVLGGALWLWNRFFRCADVL